MSIHCARACIGIFTLRSGVRAVRNPHNILYCVAVIFQIQLLRPRAVSQCELGRIRAAHCIYSIWIQRIISIVNAHSEILVGAVAIFLVITHARARVALCVYLCGPP